MYDKGMLLLSLYIRRCVEHLGGAQLTAATPTPSSR